MSKKRATGLDHVTLSEWVGVLPLVANTEDISIRPGHDKKIPTDVKFAITVTKIRYIDTKRSSVSVRMFIALTWHTPYANYRIEESQLWTPTLSFLNDDSLSISPQAPTFYPHTGMVRQIVAVDGCISQDFDLRVFPWDANDISFQMVANLNETRTVRLFWDNARDIAGVTPKVVNQRLTEWNLLEQMNSLHRVPSYRHNRLYGKYNAVQFSIVLTRNVSFFIVKIILIVVMLNIISWGTFLMHEDPVPIENGTAIIDNRSRPRNNNNKTTQLFQRPDLYIGAERFSERLEFIAGILLACVTFQFLIGESIPKIDTMTSMDWLLMSSYLTLFATSIETFAARYYSLEGRNRGIFIDAVGSRVVPIFYFVMQTGHILHAVCTRKKHLAMWRSQAGVHPAMIRSNIRVLDRVKQKKHEMLLGADASVINNQQMRDRRLEMQAIGDLQASTINSDMFTGLVDADNLAEEGGLRQRGRHPDGSDGNEVNSKYAMGAVTEKDAEDDGGSSSIVKIEAKHM